MLNLYCTIHTIRIYLIPNTTDIYVFCLANGTQSYDGAIFNLIIYIYIQTTDEDHHNPSPFAWLYLDHWAVCSGTGREGLCLPLCLCQCVSGECMGLMLCHQL